MTQTTSAPESTAAQEAASMKAEPQQAHHWLHKLVGEWRYETDVPAHGDQPATKATGTESVRSLEGLWILAEGQGEMPGGGPAKTLMTLGYDTDTKRFVGSWIGSMMTHLWIYDGELDPKEKILTLHSEGPSMAGGGKTTRYQDIIELKSADHRTLTARILGDDGTWQHLMTVEYRRKASR